MSPITLIPICLLVVQGGSTQSSSRLDGRYEGTINRRYPVIMLLKTEDGELKGAYRYTRRGVDLSLRGRARRNGSFTLYEMWEGRTSSGRFVGSRGRDGTLTGTFTRRTDGARMPFRLRRLSG